MWLLLLACTTVDGPKRPVPAAPEDSFVHARSRMVLEQIATRDIDDERVLAAMTAVERHRFMPRESWVHAYEDRPFSIGEGQTISQPYIVALMSQLAELEPGEKVLEIGTGSGYQAAVLAHMGAQVYTIEIQPVLAQRAREVLDASGYSQVHTRQGDGYIGWPEEAPFDVVLLTAAPGRIPQPLIDQLGEGGRLIAPVGDSRRQELVVLTRQDGDVTRREVIPVLFVPMTGRAQQPDPSGDPR